MKNAIQLKAIIKNLAKEKHISAQLVMQNFMLERLLERISISKYQQNFILKGGFLIAAMVGLDTRATMDMDATIKGLPVNEQTVREMFEETGLTFTPVEAGSYMKPFFTTVGMTDESCGTVFGYCSGEPSNANQEGTEDIQVVLADREECKRILKEENVAIMCAYMLMHFIASEGDPLEFLTK